MAISKEELLKKVSSIVNEAFQDNGRKEEGADRGIDSIDNHIHLYSTINRIKGADPANESLQEYCDRYIGSMDAGCPDELLYESFISGATQWNYIEPVDTELSALSKRVKNYSQDIDILKILKTMRQTESYYIVPLVEDVVSDYVRKKNPNTRMVMLNRLMCYEYDPFIKDIIATVDKDRSIENNCMYLGESIESAKSVAKTSKIYSPVQFIRENECAFAADGQYYIRKGNGLARMSPNDARRLPESFRKIAALLNGDSVQISESSIKLSGADEIATIDGKTAVIGDDSFDRKGLADHIGTGLFETASERELYLNALLLLENYNDIACLDFCKKVSLKESDDRSVDLFRLKDNIFIMQNDKAMGTSTFYRNCNPIQARKIINEHLQVNAAPLFEDLLPNQVKMLKDIGAKLKSYSEYIKTLMEKKSKYENVPEEETDEELKACNEKARQLICDELDSVKDDFRKYKEQVRGLVDIPDDDADSKDIDADAARTVTGEPKDIPDSHEPEGDGDADADDAGDEIEKDDSDVKTVDGMPDGSSLSEPISDKAEKPGDSSDDNEPDGDADDSANSIESLPDYDGVYDDAAATEGGDSDDSLKVNVDYEIIDINYSKNIKTGITYNFGNVTIKVPSVNPDGNVTNDLKNIPFNLDNDRNPILDNSYMPVDLYNGIVDAIKDCPETAEVDLDKKPEGKVNDKATPFDDNGDFFGGRKEYGDGDSDGDDFEDTIIGQLSAAGGDSRDDQPQDGDHDADADDIGHAQDDRAAKVYDSEHPLVLKRECEAYRPISMEAFKGDLNSMGISYTCSEGADEPGCISINVTCGADVRALKEYFHTWKGWDSAQFETFYPELKGTSAVLEMMSKHDRVMNALRGRGKVDEDIKVTIVDTSKEDDDDKGVIFDKTFSKEDVVAGSDDENKDVTDNPKDSMEGKEGNDDSKEDASASAGSEEQPAQESAKPKHVHFKFKTAHRMQESEGYQIDGMLLEDYVPTVCDRVNYRGAHGQIVSVLSNGDYVLVMDDTAGSTETAKPTQVKMITLKKDSVKCPCKFDEETLKLISEQYVPCGYYINGVRITPYDCKVKYSDYQKAKPSEEVSVVLEGSSTTFDKEHLKVNEAALSSFDPKNFDRAKDADGREIYYNVSESLAAGGTNAPVHVISKDADGRPVMILSVNGRIVK